MHLGIRRGEVANRILTVGDNNRAARLATTLFDGHESSLQSLKDNLHQKVTSSRGGVTHTGKYMGTKVSIVSCGLGMATTEFMVREARALTSGDMAVVRLGVCRGLQNYVPGSVVVADEARAVLQKIDASSLDASSLSDTHTTTPPVYPSDTLCNLLQQNLQQLLAPGQVHRGLNISTDDYRLAPAPGDFRPASGISSSSAEVQNYDWNESVSGLLAELLVDHPDAASCEMEAYRLLQLGHYSHAMQLQSTRDPSSKGTRLHTAAAALVLQNHATEAFVPKAEMHETENAAGEAALRCLKSMDLRE